MYHYLPPGSNLTLKHSSPTISSGKASSPLSLIEKHLQPLTDPGVEGLPVLPAPGGLQHQGVGVQEGELQGLKVSPNLSTLRPSQIPGQSKQNNNDQPVKNNLCC